MIQAVPFRGMVIETVYRLHLFPMKVVFPAVLIAEAFQQIVVPALPAKREHGKGGHIPNCPEVIGDESGQHSINLIHRKVYEPGGQNDFCPPAPYRHRAPEMRTGGLCLRSASTTLSATSSKVHSSLSFIYCFSSITASSLDFSLMRIFPFR